MSARFIIWLPYYIMPLVKENNIVELVYILLYLILWLFSSFRQRRLPSFSNSVLDFFFRAIASCPLMHTH